MVRTAQGGQYEADEETIISVGSAFASAFAKAMADRKATAEKQYPGGHDNGTATAVHESLETGGVVQI